MTSSPQGDPAVDFASVTDRSWDSILQVRRRGDGEDVVVSAICPRGTHPTGHRLDGIVYAGGGSVAQSMPSPTGRPDTAPVGKLGKDWEHVTLVCACGHQHKDRPDDSEESGCGAFWRGWAPMEGGDNGTRPPADRPPLTLEDKAWAVRAEQLPLDQFVRLRTLAGQWRNALLGMITVLSAVVIVKGTTTATDLSPLRRLLVGIITALAFLCLLVGSTLSMRGSLGSSGRLRWDSGEALRDYELRATSLAGRLMNVTRWLLLGSLLCLGVAAGIAYTNPKPPTAPIVKVQTTRDTTMCGTLKGAGPRGVRLEVTDETGRRLEALIALAELKSMRPTGSC
jgi:hypothetical protein